MKITEEDWRKEIDALRPNVISFRDLTEEQKQIIIYARENKLSFVEIAAYLSRKYKKEFKSRSINEWYHRLIKG